MCTTIVRVKLPCLWTKSQKGVFLDVAEDVFISFCVAGVALCDIVIPCVSDGMCALHTSQLSTLNSSLHTLHSTFTLFTSFHTF